MNQKYADFLFNKSRKDIFTARYLYKGSEKAYLDIACFSVQQAIEKSLKYILNVLEIDYVETNDLGKLINLINTKLPFYIPTLNNRYAKISAWATEPLYAYDFVASKNELVEAFMVYDLIMNDIKFNLKCRYSDDYNFCCKEIRDKGYKYEPEIIQQMSLIIMNLNLKRPLDQNLYTTIKHYLNNVSSNGLTTNFFS